MVSFESDFMNQNANCVDEFVENPIHGFDEFLQGMADAALGLGVPIQWCMASPNLVMASLNYPAVTNFRVSFDYCYGGSYDIGESSLLVWAVGASPSKDTLWTTDNNRSATPGCDWTVDHEAVAAELHVVLALMSTGYVKMRSKHRAPCIFQSLSWVFVTHDAFITLSFYWIRIRSFPFYSSFISGLSGFRTPLG